MRTFLLRADQVLRGQQRPPDDRAPRAPRPHSPAELVLFILLFGMLYGAVMGSFSGIWDGRWLQLLYSAVKVPMLLLVTFALSLPSYFTINTLLGLRGDFAHVIRALIASQAALMIVLASLAPVTFFWYTSSDHYDAAILFNAAMFGIASIAANGVLRRQYRPLIARNPRHRWMLRVWLLTFAFVGIQMGWTLRPFIGRPGSPEEFFRPGAWGNAYEVVLRMIWRAFSS